MSNDTTHFQSIPWVSTLLNDDGWVTVPTPSRVPKATTEDSFFATTINSPSTISACLTQYRRLDSTSSLSATSIPQSSSGGGGGGERVKKAINTNELRMFCTLGTGINGYPGVLHGGMVASLLDEVMGLILNFSQGGGSPGQAGPVTAYLNTRFKRPVETPGTVMVWGKVVETKENRKWKITGGIRDAEGNVLAEADCLYVSIRNKL